MVNKTSIGNDEWLSAARLSIATESSSHPTDIRSLNAQPWVYAGGGLGNVDECLSLNAAQPEDPLVHVCLAGGTSRDSLTFASVCVVAACTAQDLYADDFPERVAVAGFRVGKMTSTTSYFEANYHELLAEYTTLHRRIAKIGTYLQTGWVCGEYAVDWELIPSFLWCGAMMLCTLFTIIGTRRMKKDSIRKESIKYRQESYQNETTLNDRSQSPTLTTSSTSDESSCSSTSSSSSEPDSTWFWSAWDSQAHLKRLTHQRPETTCLDGLKFLSILWVIGAHIMAIQSSTGAGYLNPKDFFPPRGITTTFFGQLLFSSRFAIDTFLCVSGYLAALVLQRKLKSQNGRNSWCLSILKIVATIFFRVLRILPLYLCCLGFWMFIAPHMGSGPFWYQWEHFLEPCRQLWWTNLLFINNILPWGATTEGTCFYHSWYLAVDVQLFCMFTPWLVLIHESSPTKARKATLVLWLSSVVGTALLAYTQEWSVNSFDGSSVALFSVEGYAKPHVRAQSYLAGIFVAFWPRRPRLSTLRNKGRSAVQSGDNWIMILVVFILVTLSFVTVTGAYTRRACTFSESPFEGDDCGSIWSYSVNFMYTAFSRTAWSVCIAILLHMCLLGEESSCNDQVGKNDEDYERSDTSAARLVQIILGWSVWTPLAHLSFGAYLIHPIVIYIWFLGGREKVTFRLFTYIMEFISITVVTFFASFAVTILVEFPLGLLLRPPSIASKRRKPPEEVQSNHDAEIVSLVVQTTAIESSLPLSKPQTYGSL